MADKVDVPFIEYRVQEAKKKKEPGPSPEGPVITISREYGCPGFPIAEKVTERLTASGGHEWQFAGKEILTEAARKLKVPDYVVDRIYSETSDTLFSEWVKDASEYYFPSDLEVKKTVAGLVRSLAEGGHTVILGRAGAVITRNMKKAMHVKITAPLEVRVKKVAEKYNLSESEAKKKVTSVDRERIYLQSYYLGHEPGSDLFHIILNSDLLNEDELASVIVSLARKKQFD